jgi:leucyl/phenylalanyl-tRNA---protein transferase
MQLLTEKIAFPPVTAAEEDGLLAIGGDLSTERLIHAYSNGIFPWYNEGEVIQWWSPDPRCVLFPAQLHISKSMQKVLQSNQFTFTINNCFEMVMRNCKDISRDYGSGSWIQNEMITAYTQLHRLGLAVSAEAWQGKELAGGLYGIRMGNMFFGESMFSKITNASKFAFIQFVQQLQKENVTCIDCQVHTTHLESLGAQMIPRKDFMKLLQENI